VEIVRKALEAFEQGGLDATLPFYDREVTWEEAEDEPEAETYQGHDGLRALVGKWLVPFDDLRVEPDEFIDAGEAVVMPYRFRGRGERAGLTSRHPKRGSFGCATERSAKSGNTGTRPKPSKPWGCRSKAVCPVCAL